MQNSALLISGVLLFFGFIILISSIKIVKEYERAVIFRLGRAVGTRGPGLIFIIPLLEKRNIIDLRIRVIEIPKQEVMSTDNVPVSTNAICYYRVVNPMTAVIEVENYEEAVYQFAQATTRTVVGESHLDEVLSKREKLNLRIKGIIENMVTTWGLNVQTVEIKDVELPQTMKRAMARQAEAERDKRGRIIQAEGEQIAAEKLVEASKLIRGHPEALHLRTLQMITEVGAEHNTTTIVTIPMEMLRAFEALPELVKKMS
ncbi:MAG: SPFH domain-containing protein [Candidatus Hodarchaeales archaeon]|jgi:regulator of protease activity HflC (stomatin/prohibitin superfamily)